MKPEHRHLIEIARRAIVSALEGSPSPVRTAPPEEARKAAGVFVTLRRHRELRGCIGQIGSEEPIERIVAHCAVAAATQDERFAPVDREEIEQCAIEVSLLTEPHPISGPGELRVGVHGVMVQGRGRRGVLLPSVAVERGWDSETFLAHACRKAGLPADAWREWIRIEVFEAEVISEETD
ncbi:MAG: AmmeMemoRadiSam system protein A [Thermoanaerobaculia bacterium]